jgi:predicted transcriptional regulator
VLGCGAGSAWEAAVSRELGELEHAVMACIWRSNRAISVREVVHAMQRDRPRAYTTVLTVMDKLFVKGWLERRVDGRAYRYRATKTRAEYTATLMHEMWTRSDASPGDVATALLDMLSPDEHAALGRAFLGGGQELLALIPAPQQRG